jgi:hypothetical protein
MLDRSCTDRSVPNDAEMSSDDAGNQIMEPFKRSHFGSICFYLWNSITASLFIILVILIVDYYYDCQVKGKP